LSSFLFLRVEGERKEDIKRKEMRAEAGSHNVTLLLIGEATSSEEEGEM
jgi:hypothetical protein